MAEYDTPTYDELDDLDALTQDVALDEVAVDTDMHMSDEEMWVYKILRRAATLKGVTIKRDVFLRTELSKKCPPDVVANAVASNPHDAGISMEVVDELADAAISLETRKVAGLSALAGIPGGLAMFGTIPADLVQYFAHSLRIEQKLAYLYGWESFLNEEDEVDDDTMTRLIMFLGVMMQVGSVSVSLTKFASTTAQKSVSKTIERQALTKTAWYNPMKQILRVVGIRVTKSSFAEAVSKSVPVIGGVVSGGITYATFKPEATRLKKYLRQLTPATGVALSDEEVEEIAEQVQEETESEVGKAFSAAANTVSQKAAEAGVTSERAAEVAGAARDKAGAAARGAAAGIKRGFGGLSARIGRRGTRQDKQTDSVFDGIADQLRALKSMLDEGLITQADYDAKKNELLGL